MNRFSIVFILLVMLIPNSCIIDQNKYKETDIFEEFETQKGFTILHLPPVLFRIALSLSEESDPGSKEILDKIEVIKLMFFEENENSIKINDLRSEINDNIKKYEYNLLTKIAEEDSDISIYVIDKDKIIHEVLILIISDKEYVGLNIVGQLTKEEVIKVYKSVNMKNIQNM